MPYGRGYRKRYTRKRGGSFVRKASGYARQASSAYALAKSAWAGVKMLKSLVNVEKKKFDTEVTISNVTSSGTIYDLDLIAQGDTDQTRDGNSVLCQYINLKGRVQQANNIPSTVRLILFIDLQQIGDTAPGVNDVLDPSFTNKYSAPLNNDTVGRFKILSDKSYNFNPGSDILKSFKMFHRLTGHHIRYNGASSTDIQKGGIYLLTISDQSTLFCSIDFSSRLTFTDN